jgi:tRNA(fMet)-specific endonuclease VapC
MRYLLDTNICIYFADGRHQQVSTRISAIPAGDLGISVITYGELLYGAAKSARAAANRAVVAALVTDLVAPLPLPLLAAEKYGEAKAQLRAKGLLISDNDLWIAAHALAEGLILVTNNVSEFKRIKGLKVENWAK